MKVRKVCDIEDREVEAENLEGVAVKKTAKTGSTSAAAGDAAP